MNFNLVTNIEQCFMLIRDTVPLTFIYYSHIPVALVSLIMGIFIFIKSKRSLQGKILLGILLTFSLWLLADLVTWTNYDSRNIMLFWSFFPILNTLFFILSLYLVYVFINKKDMPLIAKVILFFLLSPMIFTMPTKLNLSSFEITECIAVENQYVNYVVFVEILVFFCIIILLIDGFKNSDRVFRRQIIFFGMGITLFLLSFFVTGLLADFLIKRGITETYAIEPYGLFGMTIFLGFLGYLIVKFKAFNIKLLGAQALVAAIVILIASQYAFIQNPTNKILNGVTLVLALAAGWVLVRSVKAEVRQRENLEIANNEISERKNQLQKISDALAVSNDRLKIANKQLETLDKVKNDFINFASHQLRTPLTGIKGYASLLKEGSYGRLESEQAEAVKKIGVAAERMSGLVEDFLNTSKIDSGGMRCDMRKNRIEDICQEVAVTLAPKAAAKNLYLEYQKPAFELPELFVDGLKIKETISNLVDNAVKYTPKGGVVLCLERKKIPDKSQNFGGQKKEIDFQDVVRVTVSDTGIGIPAGELEHLFVKFSRGSDTKRLNASGTGLGLYIGKVIVEAHGGKVWAESEGEGKGSRFIVELPVKQKESVLKKQETVL